MTWTVSAVAVVGGLGLTLLAWLVRDELRERRQARLRRQLARQYRTTPPALPPGRPAARPAALPPGRTPPARLHPHEPAELNREVTVHELRAKLRAEGLPLRLRWEAPTDPDNDWPTAVLPTTDDQNHDTTSP